MRIGEFAKLDDKEPKTKQTGHVPSLYRTRDGCAPWPAMLAMPQAKLDSRRKAVSIATWSGRTVHVRRPAGRCARQHRIGREEAENITMSLSRKIQKP